MNLWCLDGGGDGGIKCERGRPTNEEMKLSHLVAKTSKSSRSDSKIEYASITPIASLQQNYRLASRQRESGGAI